MIETKTFRTFIRIYSLFKSERLSAKNKLILHKALIRLVMTYVNPAWKLVADTYILKLQRLQNDALRAIGKLPWSTSILDLYTTFNLLYVYNYTTEFACKKQKSYKITRMNMFAVWVKSKPDIENIRCLNLAVAKLMTGQITRLPL
jgi:hypothetical protein